MYNTHGPVGGKGAAVGLFRVELGGIALGLVLLLGDLIERNVDHVDLALLELVALELVDVLLGAIVGKVLAHDGQVEALAKEGILGKWLVMDQDGKMRRTVRTEKVKTQKGRMKGKGKQIVIRKRSALRTRLAVRVAVPGFLNEGERARRHDHRDEARETAKQSITR